MKKPPRPSPLHGLPMPLRDALRGMSGFAEAAEEALAPAASILPEPIRSRFRDALRSLERRGKGLINTAISAEQIVIAGNFISGTARGADAASSCAAVFCFAWDHLAESRPGQTYLISETLLSAAMQEHAPPPDQPPSLSAAALYDRIRASAAIGNMPGFIATLSTQSQQEIDLSLLAIIVWLLSDRAATLAEEENLLELSLALVTAIQTDVSAALGNSEKLAQIIESSSEHL